MEKEEKMQKLQSALEKEKTLSSLSKTLELSEFEVLGYVRELKSKGVNISYYEKNGEEFVVRNDHPDFSKENSYRIEANIDEVTKIAVISDLRFGSKHEQIAIINDMYKKFAESGVKYVLIAGNLIEGIYTGNDALEFGRSLITNDAMAQADHFIEFFPKVEGIQTLFITGKNEHKCSKKLNVGEYIAKNRSDMTYLGPKSCTVYFNNVSFKLEQLKKGDAYTIAYPPQKYSRSMSSYEDFDVVLLSGTLSAQHFPQIRDTQIFAVPSVVERTPKMVDANQQNTIGALLFDIHYAKTGKLKRLVPTVSPYYVPSKENYLTVKKLNMAQGENGALVSLNDEVKNTHAYFDCLDRIYKLMKKEQTFTSLKEKLEMKDEELMGIIDILQEYGRPIEIVDVNGELVVRKYFQKRHHYEIKPPREELHKKELFVASDTHYGSIWCQPSMVNTGAYEAYNRGITDALHIGDITDGDYSKIRPNHINEVFLFGATGQLDYTAKNLPKYPGMKWHVIAGSHDQTHQFNYGMVLGEELEKRRPDVEYLGQDRAIFEIDNCKIELFHPGGGTSRIYSTKPQNGIDQMPSRTKPNLSIRGHYHKVYYMLYRNIHTILAPCNVDQSSFMMKNEIPNLMGNYFLTIYYDDNGDIHYLTAEPMIFEQKDVRKYDFENPRKSIKSKILTLNK
jgi:biotin operon repressor